MKHKLQSSIFLQPIDQHFFTNKAEIFSDEKRSDFFKGKAESQKTDCLDNSTESDSGESKNENDFFTESNKSSLRKTSQIAEFPVEQKVNLYEFENLKIYENVESKIKKNENFNFEKNFHVPNFLLLDSEDEQTSPISQSSLSAESQDGLDSNAKGRVSIFKQKSFVENNNNFHNLSFNNDNYENNKNTKNFSFNFKNNKCFFGKQEINTENENEKLAKISDLLHIDWKSKISAQIFLKFNAYRKKVFDSFSKKGQNKKNKNSNKDVKKTNSQNNLNFNNCNINNPHSYSSTNLKYNHPDANLQNNNFNSVIFNNNNKNNFSCIGNLNNNFYNNENKTSNKRKFSNNANLNLNQINQNFQVQTNLTFDNNFNDNRLPIYDLQTQENNEFNINENNNFIYSNNNINLRKNSAQNFRNIPFNNFPNGNLPNSKFNNLPIENRANPNFNQISMMNFNNFPETNIYNNNNFINNIPKPNMPVKHASCNKVFYNCIPANNNNFYN